MSNIQKRLPGKLSKIDIYPIIDGRRKGIRESLEEQTTNIAKFSADLIVKSFDILMVYQ